MKKVAIMAIMQQFDPQFSLSNCIREQLEVLAANGYKPIFITIEGFQDEKIQKNKNIEVRAILPQWKLHGIDFHMNKAEPYTDEEVKQIFEAKQDYIKKDVFKKRAGITWRAMYDNMQDIDICITHDIMFIDWNLPYNQAVRYMIEVMPNLKWLHLFHSGPQQAPCLEMPYPTNLLWDLSIPKSRFIYLNHSDKTRFAFNYKIPIEKVRVLHNIRDVRSFFDFHNETIKFIDKYELLDCDILMVYPTSLQPFKQVPRIIDLAAAFKRAGYRTKVVIITSYSQNYERIIIKKAYKQRGRNKRLGRKELIFTNEIKAFEIGTPNWFVRELLQISNIFVHPSTSEACSLIMIEAMLARNFLILNGDLNAFHDFGQHDAFYMPFCSATTSTTYSEGFDKFCDEAVPQIMAWYNQNHALKGFWRAKKMFSREEVWRNLQQIIEEKWDDN